MLVPSLVLLATQALAQTASPPEVVGTLVGPGASPSQPGLHVYGTDLGWTFEHRGDIVMLFGDTWPTASSLCEGEPRNDDTVATLPLVPPASGVPPLTFVTRADAPDEFAPILATRDGESLTMAYGQVPVAGFSDGTRVAAVLGRGEYVRCTPRGGKRKPSCPKKEGLTCTQEVGECLPATLAIPPLCDLATGTGCLPGSTCAPSTTGFCVDPTSSQNDGTTASLRFQIAHDQDIALQDPASPAQFTSVAQLATNKFINVAARTVRCFSGRTCGGDYGPGHGALLLWGRPGFQGLGQREAQLYLMAHRLPIRLDKRGRMELRPSYFAGVDTDGEPRWSRRQHDAVPLALDGAVGGSPHEAQPVVNQLTVAWIGAPVNKWMMLYGGDLADYLLPDPAAQRLGPVPGAIRIRWADHPWGPWTAAEPHLGPGDPAVPGNQWGPGGVLFHDACVDTGTAVCAPSDPTRPPDFFLPGCPSFGAAFDVGRFYAPSIIDPYTRPAGPNAVDVFWNVSTWNPYAVVLMKTRVAAAADAAAPPACARRRKQLRWCES